MGNNENDEDGGRVVVNNSKIKNPESVEAKQRKMKLLKQRTQRRARDQAMRDLGLVRVRGAVSGKIYWE